MYTVLLKNNLTSFLPKTYIDLENININIFQSNKIFFLKQICSAGGKQVYAINDFQKMSEIINYKYSKKYKKNDMSNEIHNDVYHSSFFNFSDQSYYNYAFLKIKDICSKSSKCFKETQIENNNFIILGYDFILNNRYEPYLIEVNSYPNLHPNCEVIKNKKMLKDFVNLYLENKTDNDWIEL